MSTNTKNCPVQKKQTREKPATPPPPPVPVFAKIPCKRDQQAYALHLAGHSQRWIAAQFKCAQPTVMRGIRRMEKWLATTLPEDRGEYTATEKLRLALAKHERLMEGVIKVSLREFRRSRKTIPMKKRITTTDTTNAEGEKVKIRVEEWEKPQIGRKGFIDAAAKASHEITVLAAGWLGPGNGSMSMAKVMDPEERDRWDRIVTTQDAQIKELQESRRVHAAERNARASDECSVVNQPQSNADPACISQSLIHPTPPREQSAQRPTAHVSEVAEKEPALNQETANQCVTTSSRPRVCAASTDIAPRETSTRKTCIKSPPKVGPLVPAESETCAEQPPAPPPQPLCRWSDEHRQEALDLHCTILRIPRAKLSQASGIPDPKNMTPKRWVELRRPYSIIIDTSEEDARLWKANLKVWEKRDANLFEEV